jgi:SanA protein
LCNFYILSLGAQLISDEIATLKPAQVVIVLGAGVSTSGELSPVFKERIDTALMVYQAGLVEKVLVSGDNSSLRYNEVIPAREYLIMSGVPESDIFVDYAGFNTYDTMYRARNVFKVESAIVVTQSFHLPRAVVLASVFEIPVQGVPASPEPATWRNNVREIAARVKAVGDIVTARDPRYGGAEIPVSGDGRTPIGT